MSTAIAYMLPITSLHYKKNAFCDIQESKWWLRMLEWSHMFICDCFLIIVREIGVATTFCDGSWNNRYNCHRGYCNGC